jgi:uncharacterized repeat protein (TIGR03833 family)
MGTRGAINHSWFGPLEGMPMDKPARKAIRAGVRVSIVLKGDQRTGKRTVGIVKDILTSSAVHPHGIKVRLEDGQIGRVQDILDDPAA